MNKFDILAIDNLVAGIGIYNNRIDELTMKRGRFVEALEEKGLTVLHSIADAAADAMWKRYLELRRSIKNEQDRTKKIELIDEYAAIGRAYDFPAICAEGDPPCAHCGKL